MNLTPDKAEQLLKGEILLDIDWLASDAIGASGCVFVKAPKEIVWGMLTDYGNLHHTMPKVTSSRLLEADGPVKIIEQTGKSGIFIFERSVRFRLRVEEEFPTHLRFRQLEGDFKVYEGNWLLEPASGMDGPGTIVTYEAKMKPDFFAPPILVSFVQSQDLPAILRSIRTYCEPRAAG
ncbi:MAG: cyclase [Chlorobiaceae bacterium]|nr:cyclase [Chlorobiaceae bacterium]NTW74792.1 cyclase [Chlorobiaceae bacterium]